MIVTQVAVTVAFPVTTFFVRRDMVQIRSPEIQLAAEQYLSTRLEMDREAAMNTSSDTSDAAFIDRFQATYRELEQRLEAEPAVAGVTFAEQLPRMYHEYRQVELDRGAAAPKDTLTGHRVASSWIDADYFDVLGARVLSGRGFRTSDVTQGARVAIVNQSFVDEILVGRNPLGKLVRWSHAEQPLRGDNASPWHEIVGVVPDLGTRSGYGNAGFYVPMHPGSTEQLYMAVHVMGDAMSFSRRLREIAADTEPVLRLHELQSLDNAADPTLRVYGLWLRLSVIVSAVALVLSLSGICAVTSFAVSRRTREIGIRIALGAGMQRVVTTILRRPLTQIGFGVLAGSVIAGALSYGVLRGSLWPTGAALVVVYAAFMLGVCMLACLVPILRAFRVQPTEALSAEG